MSRKLIVILSGLIIVIVIAIGCFVYFKNQSDTKTATKPIDSSSNYYVEKGAENHAKIVKPAVESYANQDVSEPLTSRNKRLAAYFADDSPVYNRDIEIRSTNSAIKTKARVTSVAFPNGEGLYQTLIVKADVTSYAGANNITVSQTYWVTIKKGSNGALIVNDIGMFEK